MSKQIKDTLSPASQPLSNQVLTGVIATVLVVSAEKLIQKIARQPLLVFGFGVVSGLAVYKYRKHILETTSKTLDQSKAVLEQKEKLLDLIAEVNESE